MLRLPIRSGLVLALTTFAVAQAQTYQLGFSHVDAQQFGVQGFGVGLDVSAWPWAGNLLSAGVSERSLSLGLRRNLPLLTVGTASVNLTGAYSFEGGGKLGLEAALSAGPVALSASLSGWNTAVWHLAPLDIWSLRGADLREQGGQLGVQARYRLRRDLVLSATGQWDSQRWASLQAEWRRGALSYRLGGQLGGGQLAGVLGGLSYRSDALTLSGDVLLGSQVGFSAQVDAPAALPLGQNAADLSAYLAYQSWRGNVAKLRYGVGLSLPTSGQNTWQLRLLGGTGGYGAALGWRHTSP